MSNLNDFFDSKIEDEKFRIKNSYKGYYYSVHSIWEESYDNAWEFDSHKEALQFAKLHLKNENIIIENFYKI